MFQKHDDFDVVALQLHCLLPCKYWLHVTFTTNTNFVVSFLFVWPTHVTAQRGTRQSVFSPAATADHMTKNIPTAILFREEGSRPRRFRMGSTTLSLRGISIRMSTASNMVSQAAGKRNVIWEGRDPEEKDEVKLCRKAAKHENYRGCLCIPTQRLCACVSTFSLILLWHPQVVKSKHNEMKKYSCKSQKRKQRFKSINWVVSTRIIVVDVNIFISSSSSSIVFLHIY